MKVLLVSHNYPPRHLAGTEVYTAGLARELSSRGVEVLVFTTEKDISRPHLEVVRREFQGIAVVELINNLHYQGFRETWELPAVDEAFARVLAEFQPDVVHLHHLMYLSVGVAERAAASGAKVVFTLHDYWLQCARFGQRLHPDGSICHDLQVERCAECLLSFRFSNSGLEQQVAGLLAKLRSHTGLDLGPPARRAGDWLRGRKQRGAADSPATDSAQLSQLEDEVRARDEGLRTRLLAAVDRFLSPSAFLRGELVAWGLPPERIDHLASGVDLQAFGTGQRAPRGRLLRVGFIGSLVPVKGAHVLLEAWAMLEPDLRSCATLEVFGPALHEPDYARQLEELASTCGAKLAGSLERGEVAHTLRSLDLLVVPSLWYENQPLIILEALAARTPLAVADLGGMAELVEVGESGYRFAAGDAEALAQLLTRVLSAPEQLDALYSTPPELPSIADQTDAILAVYDELSGRP